MRMEYVIVGFILALIVLLVSIGLLSGVIPGFDSAANMLETLIP